MNTTNGSNYDSAKAIFSAVKTVNGKPVGECCVTCDTIMERGRWLCSKCSVAIGSENINSTVASMPEYLHDSQYEKWLKVKLLEFMS